MKTSHSPEITLLLMACTLEVSAEKKGQLIQFLAQHPLNWDRLYKLAARHRVTPFLYRTLQHIPDISEAFLSTLKQDCRLAATDNLLKLHQYHVVAALLTENAIPHVALKGIYLAEHCYPDSSLRISGDIDILVSQKDAFRTIHLLQTHDYHLSQKHSLHWRHGEQVILADLFEVSLFKPFFNGNHFDIDLHWRMLGFNKHYATFDLAYIRSQPVFSTEREVVLLVAHHGVTNIWQQIYYVNDLYFFLCNKDIDWPWLMQELRRYGFEQVFLAGLYWCRQIWPIELPAFMQALVTSSEVCSLAETYAENWETETAHEFSSLIVRQSRFFLKAQTQLSKQIKIVISFCTSRIVSFSTFKIGNRLIYVPKQFGFITVFIRALRSLFRFLPAF